MAMSIRIFTSDLVFSFFCFQDTSLEVDGFILLLCYALLPYKSTKMWRFFSTFITDEPEADM
jgi:hypothetical protein